MSWYADTQWFILNGLHVYRIKKEYCIPVVPQDFEDYEAFSFSKHLSLGNNRESDYAAFVSIFRPNGAFNNKAINSQGLVITLVGNECTWSREEHNSLFYNLPGVTNYESVTALLAADTKQALKKKVSKLEAKISSLQEEAKSNKDDKQAMDKRLASLQAENYTLKDEVKRLTTDSPNAEKSTDQKRADLEALIQRGGAGGESSLKEQPWISGHTVPINWVPFDELDVIKFSKRTSLTITKDAGAPKFLEDNTTNVRVNHFYRGVYPIALVNVEELIPNREEARFDPCVWGTYNNAGISYAARKQFASEIAVNASKTC